jgi:hypothetical protein
MPKQWAYRVAWLPYRSLSSRGVNCYVLYTNIPLVCLFRQILPRQGRLMPDLRVLIVADDPLVRPGLATVLTHQPGYTAVGQMAGDADALYLLGLSGVIWVVLVSKWPYHI